MPDHVHAIVAFHNTGKTVNSIVGNGKRFMAYDIVAKLKSLKKQPILSQLEAWVNETQQKDNKQHEIFEPSFEWKECRTTKFIEQKLKYIHLNPCRSVPGLASLPEDYLHSSQNITSQVNEAYIPLQAI